MRAVFAALCNPETTPEDSLLNLPRDDDDDSARPGKSGKLARDIAASFSLRRKEIELMLEKASSYAPEDITMTERAVVCAGAAEMLARPQTPVAVVINEFVEIARRHGEENGAKFVNAALDRIARGIRASRDAS